MSQNSTIPSYESFADIRQNHIFLCKHSREAPRTCKEKRTIVDLHCKSSGLTVKTTATSLIGEVAFCRGKRSTTGLCEATAAGRAGYIADTKIIVSIVICSVGSLITVAFCFFRL